MEKIETELRILSDKLTSITAIMPSTERINNEIVQTTRKLDELTNEIKKVESKTPPIATLLAAFGILAAAVGGSLFNTISLKNNVTELSNELENVQEKITNLPKDFDDSVDSVLTQIENISTSVLEASNKIDQTKNSLELAGKEMSDRAKFFSLSVNDQLKKVSELDKSVASLISRLGTSAPSINEYEHQLEPSTSSIVSQIINRMGIQVPTYIRYLVEAESLLESEQFSEARTILFKAQENDSETRGIYDSKIAFTYQRENDYSLAVQHYKDAINIDPEEETYHNNLGIAYLEWSKSDPDRRIEHLTEAVKFHHNAIKIVESRGEEIPSTIASNLAEDYMEMNRLDEALKTLDQYGDSQNAQIKLDYARIYAARGDLSNSLIHLNELARIDPYYAVIVSVDDHFKKFHNEPSFRKLIESLPGGAGLLNR